MINGDEYDVVAEVVRFHSRWLDGLFASGCTEVEQRRVDLRCAGVSPAAVRELLTHLYGEALRPRAETAQGLVLLSRHMQVEHVERAVLDKMPELVRSSAQLLASDITTPSLLDACAATVKLRKKDTAAVLALADQYGAEKLAAKAADAVAEGAGPEELGALPPAKLRRVCASSKLRLCEDQVLDVVAAAAAREGGGGAGLLGLVRLDLLSTGGLRRAAAAGADRDAVLDAALRHCVAKAGARAWPPTPPPPRFDAGGCASGVTVSAGGAVATFSAAGPIGGWQGARAAATLLGGKHAWRVRVEQTGFDLMIGVACEEVLVHTANTAFWQKRSWMLQKGTNCIWHQEQRHSAGASSTVGNLQDGEVVEVRLDCLVGTMEWAVVGDPSRTARCTGLPTDGTALVPCVDGCGTPRVRFVDADQ